MTETMTVSELIEKLREFPNDAVINLHINADFDNTSSQTVDDLYYYDRDNTVNICGTDTRHRVW